jgi:hypothetical protein
VENEFSNLPLHERVAAFRTQAMKALKAAEASDSEMVREHFSFIAIQWEELAKDVELQLAGSKTVRWIKSE